MSRPSRHIYGKWACRCCQRQGIERLVQEPAEPQIVDRGIPASGLVAHTLISRFVDHLAVLPAGDDQRPIRRAHAALDAGRLGRHGRRGAGAAL